MDSKNNITIDGQDFNVQRTFGGDPAIYQVDRGGRVKHLTDSEFEGSGDIAGEYFKGGAEKGWVVIIARKVEEDNGQENI